MVNNDSFPPATARVIFLTAKDFADNGEPHRHFFILRNDVFADRQNVASILPTDDLAVETQVFNRVNYCVNGKFYPVYIDNDNIKYVLPILDGIVDERVCKGKKEYELKLKEKERELEAHLKYLQAEFILIKKSKAFRFMQFIENIVGKFKICRQRIESFYKYRLRIERIDG